MTTHGLDSELSAAAARWYERDVALDARGLTIKDIAALDVDLDRHLFALLVAGDAGWATVEAAFAHGDPGTIFAGAWLAVQLERRDRFDRVVAEAAKDHALFRGVESALGWCEIDEIRALLDRLLASQDVTLRRVALAAFAVHRVDPGPVLAALVTDRDRPLRARAVKAAWQLGRSDLLPLLRDAYSDDDIATRFSACWGGATMAKDASAVRGLMRFAEDGSRYPDRAVQLAGLCMDPRAARAWQRSLPAPLAILGAAALGEAEDVAWLRAQPNGEEALETILGATPQPLAPNVRHMLGHPVTPAWLRQVLVHGEVRHRTLAATELALIEGGPCLEVREHGLRQIAALSS